MGKRPRGGGTRDLEAEMEAAGVEVLLVHRGGSLSSEEAYAKLRRSIDGAIGVDCEGTDGDKGRHGPLMIQAASSSIVVVESPARNGRYSEALRELLADPSITKVFCQADGDLRSLAKTSPPLEVVSHADIKEITDLPPNPVPGLAAILSRADPDGMQWTKQSIKKRKWWMLASSDQMLAEPGFVQYAAADAWGTLFAHSVMASSGRAKRSRASQ
mmetsp:Transcript_2839/g.5608  ORF Transcript_2839/g.5608 Transcript_2839/m.5608 type:complete len:215 (-) Transcript_2839:84-728(-)